MFVCVSICVTLDSFCICSCKYGIGQILLSIHFVWFIYHFHFNLIAVPHCGVNTCYSWMRCFCFLSFLSTHIIIFPTQPSWCFCQWCMQLTVIFCRRVWQVDCHNQWHSGIKRTLGSAWMYRLWTGTSQSRPILVDLMNKSQPLKIWNNSESKTKYKNHYNLNNICKIIPLLCCMHYIVYLCTFSSVCTFESNEISFPFPPINGFFILFASLKSLWKSLCRRVPRKQWPPSRAKGGTWKANRAVSSFIFICYPTQPKKLSNLTWGFRCTATETNTLPDTDCFHGSIRGVIQETEGMVTRESS